MAEGFVHTVHKDDQWVNEYEGGTQIGGVHATKEEAVKVGRAAAQQDKTEHVIHKQDGTIGERNSYGRGPASRANRGSPRVLRAVVLIVGILIASWIVGQGDGNGKANVDAFPAIRAWLYVAIVGAAYMVSRGLAKAGSSDPYWSTGVDLPGGDEADRPPRRESTR